MLLWVGIGRERTLDLDSFGARNLPPAHPHVALPWPWTEGPEGREPKPAPGLSFPST